MSYGYYKLPRKVSKIEYLMAIAKSMGLQGNEVIGNTINIPGDDQSLPEMSKSMPPEHPVISDPMGVDIRAQGYTGDVCATCQGSRMRWAGHCQVCEDCGESSGCS